MADCQIDTDVLVLGGGLAGCVAAIRAREQGAKVTLVDKSAIQRSGEAGRGSFFNSTYFNTGEPWDTPESHRQWWRDIRYGLVDMKVIDAVVIETQPAVAQYVEKLGISLKDPRTGQYTRWGEDALRGRPQTRFFFRGENIKLTLAQRVREAGVEVVERVQVTSLLTSRGRVVGAAGFHNRDGDFYTFKAKAVVLATGSAQRVYDSPNGNPFNSYRKPWHAGTGHALAFRVGAELSCMEFISPGLSGRWTNGAMLGILVEAGARMVNGLGQPIVSRPDQPGEFGIGTGGTYAAFRELNAGRGPIYYDARRVSKEQIEEAIRKKQDTELRDMPMTMEYLERTGVSPAGGLVELTPYLFTGNRSGCPKGVIVDEKCQSCVEGLFVIGDLSNASDTVTGALTTGYVAGPEAARLAAGVGPIEPDKGQVQEERERAFAPLQRRDGIRWDELEKMLRHTMTARVGAVRTELGLMCALRELEGMEEYSAQLSAANCHELMRAHEALDTVVFSKVMAAAALERTESRHGFAMSHYRADYPRTDDTNWWGVATVVKREGDRTVSSRRRLTSREQ